MSEARDSEEAGDAQSEPDADESDSIDLTALDPTDYRTRSGSFGESALPHRYTTEGVTFEIETRETDTGEELPVEPTTNQLSAIGVDWETITITGTIKVEEWAFEHTVPTDATGRLDADWTPRLGVVYWCRDTIMRDSSTTVSVREPGSYGPFKLTIDREDVWKSTHFRPVLVRGSPDEGADPDPDDEYATYAGQRLTDGNTWTLRLDRERSTSNLLHPETKNFSNHDDLPGSDHLVFVDLDRDPPGVYLNGDHERIVAALDDDANKGWDASTREVVYDMIEAEVWPQFIMKAASEITEESGPETPWKKKTIEKFREDIYGEDTTYEEAIDLLREDVSTPERLPRLMQDIDDAIQSRNDPPDHLSSLFSLIDKR